MQIKELTLSEMGGGGSTATKEVGGVEIRRAVQPLQASPIRSLTGRFARYGREITPPQYTDNQSNKKGIWWDIAPDEEYFKELFRVSEHQIIWGGNYFPLPPTRCFLIWRKLSISEQFSMAMAEYAWTSFNANAKVFECAPQGTKADPRFHPTQKPIDLYRWIFLNYVNKGDNILDTHLGSGSSACAAYELGLDFTGTEIDNQYFEQACERLKRFARNNQPLLDL